MKNMEKMWKSLALLQLGAVVPMFLVANVSVVAAQQVNGVPGSPSATTTIDGKQIPPPPPKFGGVIKEGAKDSTPWWPPRVVPPKGAPNVLLIMTDDQGYGVPGTFGGVIPTPALDRIATSGLRYIQFHSTALCSPTRAALITGRNHHSVGFGVVGELSTGYPGYDSVIGPEHATIGELWAVAVLLATSVFGLGRGRPIFTYNLLDLERFRWRGPSLNAGKRTIIFDFKYDGPGPGKGGTGVLMVDGKEADRKTMPHSIPVIVTMDETFDVGVDTRTPVDFSYDVPFRFNGTIDKLTFKLGPSQMTAEEQKKAAEFLARAAD